MIRHYILKPDFFSTSDPSCQDSSVSLLHLFAVAVPGPGHAAGPCGGQEGCETVASLSAMWPCKVPVEPSQPSCLSGDEAYLIWSQGTVCERLFPYHFLSVLWFFGASIYVACKLAHLRKHQVRFLVVLILVSAHRVPVSFCFVSVRHRINRLRGLVWFCKVCVGVLQCQQNMIWNYVAEAWLRHIHASCIHHNKKDCSSCTMNLSLMYYDASPFAPGISTHQIMLQCAQIMLPACFSSKTGIEASFGCVQASNACS